MKTKKRCQFIEEEASEGYSSEEIDDQNYELNKIEAEKQYQKILERRQKQQKSLEKKLEKLMNEDNIDEQSNTNSNDISQNDQQNQDESFQDGPNQDDPKIWRFKCGRSLNQAERIFQIIKFLPKNSLIISVFFNPNIKGFIFFEAYNDQDIKILMKEIMYGEPLYVQPEDCYSLIEIKRNTNIQIGQWIRFRNHRNYGTDLGKVMRVNRITNLAIIKVIKRNKKGQKEPISWQRTREQAIQKKYESEFIYSDIEQEFKCAKIDGFELLKCNLKNLEHNITITDEELQMFYPDVMDRKILVQQAKRELLRRVDVQFKEGQKVRLIGEDDLNQGPRFKIKKIFDDQMIELTCKQDNREYTYLVHASEIRLAFKLYQEVKVIDGPHKGDVGVIICIKQGYVVLSTLYGTIKVPHSVIQFGHKSYQTMNQLIKFGDHDFQIGCIIEQKLLSVIILDINNQIQEIPIQKIEIINTKKVEMNQRGDTFKENDNIKINGGIYKEKIGMIKHCFNGKVYVFNHQFPHSIILEDINNCSLVFSKQYNQKQNDKRQMIGQICMINNGQYKNYRAQILNCKQGYLLVQLQTNNQKINIKESDITLL